MVEFRSNVGEKPVDALAVKDIPNIGELTVGGTNDPMRVVIAALAALNNPNVNEVLLAFRVKFSDRFTKTRVFPRDGMALPDGEVYKEEPKEEIVELV
jgi:hypothetical protein